MRPEVLAAILAMALVTYATRAGGYWLMGAVSPSPRVVTALRAAPGALLVAMIAPKALAGGPAEIVSVAITALAMALSRNELVAIAAGVAAIAALRRLAPGS